MMKGQRLIFGGLLFTIAWVACRGPLPHSYAAQRAAATVELAARVLDLSTFPMYGEDPQANHRVVASQSYIAKAGVVEVAKLVLDALLQQGWAEAAPGAMSDGYASATLSRDDFVVSLLIMPAGEPGRVVVTLANHGNVDLGAIPVPAESAQLFSSPVMILYQSQLAEDQVRLQAEQLLKQAGWEPFGGAEGSFYMKKNAVKLLVRVAAAAALNGKTTIQIGSEQLSLDLPVPADAEGIQYADSLGTLLFDSPQSKQRLIAFYRDSLAKRNWTATTDEPVKLDARDHLIFRNPQNEMLDWQCYEVDNKMRVALKFSTAQQVTLQSERAAAVAAQRQSELIQVVPKLQVRLPQAAKIAKKTGKRIEFSVSVGSAQQMARAITATLQADGWKPTVTISESVAGETEFEKSAARLQLSYADTGLLPAELSLQLFGNGELVVSQPSR